MTLLGQYSIPEESATAVANLGMDSSAKVEVKGNFTHEIGVCPGGVKTTGASIKSDLWFQHKWLS